MILLRNLRLAPGEDPAKLKALAAKRLRLSVAELRDWRIVRRSLDARKKNDIHYIYSVAFSTKGEEQLLRRFPGELGRYEPPVYSIPGVEEPELRPVIAGFGPAGMFAALVLARAGARPIVLERGSRVEERTKAVEAFRKGGALDPECNVQFGEGGAGTFSDGKLATGIKDPRLHFVMQEFAAHGAKPSVVYDAKPHVGTDVLAKVVRNLREEILALGGELRFNTRLEGLRTENGSLTAVELLGPEGRELLPCRQLILAVGHSARDTFEMLRQAGIPMEPKPFSMGVRIEHRQSMTDLAQYGRPRGDLPAADYSLNVHLPDGSSAYTFCMCPGGYVFAAASEEGGVCTNGMSYSGRSGENSNAALLVTLEPGDFPYEGPLGGMYWQREMEQKAFRYGGSNYYAPAQRVEDFLQDRPSAGPGTVQPTYTPGVRWGDLRQVYPERITGVLKNALPELGKKLRGFDDPDAVLTAPETRSSSPVRILRDAECRSALQGLYPCGEGAGYAGGISSAAVDGMRCAEAVLRELTEEA